MFMNLDIATLIARAITLLIAFTIHELAHAVSADYLGDDTAKRRGRVTLNPLAHLDPIGTFMLLVAGFGWAKPVPVNPMNLRGNPRTSMAIVALAGPVSNLLLASLAVIPFRLNLVNIVGAFTSSGVLPSLPFLLFEFVWINIILAVFNMIPIPPLDGYKILYALLPDELAFRLEPLEQYGFLILLGLLFLPSLLPGVPDIIGGLMITVAGGLLNLMLGIAVF